MVKINNFLYLIYWVVALFFVALRTNWFRYDFDLISTVTIVIILLPVTLIVYLIHRFTLENDKLKWLSVISKLLAIIFIIFFHLTDHHIPAFYLNDVHTSSRQILKSSYGNIEYYVKNFNPWSKLSKTYLIVKEGNRENSIELSPSDKSHFDDVNNKVPAILYSTKDNKYILELIDQLSRNYFSIDFEKNTAIYIQSYSGVGGACNSNSWKQCIIFDHELSLDRSKIFHLGLNIDLQQDNEVIAKLFLFNQDIGYIPLNLEADLNTQSISDFENIAEVNKVEGNSIILVTKNIAGNHQLLVNIDKKTSEIIK